MGKLHEVLAVEGDLQTTAKNIREEAIVTFSKKPDHFLEETSDTKHFADDQSHLDTSETKAMTTTVFDKLEYVAPMVSRYLDAFYQKETTNQLAKADLKVDDQVLLKDVPATVLLGMETKLKEIRAVYEHIPTLQPGVHWELDKSKPGGVYKSSDTEERFVTKRNIRPIEMSPATKEHPAQVQAVQEDQPVAKKTITKWSGMISPAQKSDLLERVDILIRAVKKARQRANNQEAVESNGFGKLFFDFIHRDIVTT